MFWCSPVPEIGSPVLTHTRLIREKISFRFGDHEQPVGELFSVYMWWVGRLIIKVTQLL
jgi:hypothetical protein